jgi:hypothetical protein
VLQSVGYSQFHQKVLQLPRLVVKPCHYLAHFAL